MTEAAVETSAGTSAGAPGLLRRVFALDLLDNRYPALHGLRVVAIASVVQIHVTSMFMIEEKLPFDPDFAAASLAVFFGMDLFFMLSGFLIGSILLHSIDSSGQQHVRRFWLRRAFRTFPAYYVVLILLAILVGMNATQRHNFPYELAYLTNYRVLKRATVVMLWGWSLAVEEQFYLTVPLLLFLLSRLRGDRERVLLLFALWLSALVVRLFIFFRWYGHWDDDSLYRAVYFKTHTRFDTLIAGVMLAYVNRRWRSEIRAWLQRPGARATLAIVALACLSILMRPWMFGPQWLLLVRIFDWGTLTTIMYFCWVLLLLNSEGWISRVLSAPFWRRIATLGYGVYLVHIPLCAVFVTPYAKRAVKDWHVPMLVVWPLSVLGLLMVSLVFSYAIHVVVEKPALWVRDKLAP
jgi:peptidoglycan/LPS O-acetylase OafA/YrhL